MGSKVIPEFLVKQATANGWKVSVNSRRSTCPDCVSRRKDSAHGESPKTLTLAPKLKETPAIMVAPTPLVPAKPIIASPKVAHTPLGVKDRIRVRGMIMEHFDEERGCWKRGWTDQRVAIEASVEVPQVAEIREAAFGPIRTTEEAETAREDLVKLKQQMADHMAALVSDFDTKTSQLRTLFSNKISMIEKLLGDRAA